MCGTVLAGLKMLIQTLFEALPLLVDVFFLLMWVFFVFGIVGLTLFMGKLRRRCFQYFPDNGSYVLDQDLLDQPCAKNPPGLFTCPSDDTICKGIPHFQ